MSDKKTEDDPAPLAVDPSMKTAVVLIYSFITLGFGVPLGLGFKLVLCWIVAGILAYQLQGRTDDDVCRSHFANALTMILIACGLVIIAVVVLLIQALVFGSNGLVFSPRSIFGWASHHAAIYALPGAMLWMGYRLLRGWIGILRNRAY